MFEFLVKMTGVTIAVLSPPLVVIGAVIWVNQARDSQYLVQKKQVSLSEKD